MARTQANPALDRLLCFSIYSTSHAVTRLYKPLLDELGLTYPQYVTMVALWEKDGQTVGEIGDRVLLETNTLTPLLKRLESAGFVRRERDPVDERQVRVQLTDEGKALSVRAENLPETVGCLMEVTLEEFGYLNRALSSLRDRLNAKEKARAA